MCNYSEAIWMQGIEKGITQGMAQGKDIGAYETILDLVRKKLISIKVAAEQLAILFCSFPSMVSICWAASFSCKSFISAMTPVVSRLIPFLIISDHPDCFISADTRPPARSSGEPHLPHPVHIRHPAISGTIPPLSRGLFPRRFRDNSSPRRQTWRQ